MNLADQEVIRGRWRRQLGDWALDTTTREDFGRGRLSRRLQDVTVQLALLPPDPEGNLLQIDESFSAWLVEHRYLDLDGSILALPATPQRTAHAIALTSTYGEKWDEYFAIHRSGAIEVGMGSRGGWVVGRENDETGRAFALTPVVAHVWAMLKVAGLLADRVGLQSPLCLAVGVVDTMDAVLGVLGEGWAEPSDFQNRVGGCRDPHLLWKLELLDVPNHESARHIAYSIGDRLEDAWGVSQRRYLSHRGQHAGHLDPRRFR